MLVNTARSGLVDEPALIRVLQERRIIQPQHGLGLGGPAGAEQGPGLHQPGLFDRDRGLVLRTRCQHLDPCLIDRQRQPATRDGVTRESGRQQGTQLPTPPAQELPDLRAATCGACHGEIYQEWRVSTHAQAWTDRQLQAEMEKSGNRWLCANCHTPLLNQMESWAVGLEEDDVERPLYVDNPAFDGGFRDDSGYRQFKLHANTTNEFMGGTLTSAFSATDLDQETAGFIVGEDAYKDPAVNRSNPNPEAFRKASSQRLYGIWNGTVSGRELDVRPFLRHSDMEFLQHFLPGQPLEENGHVSAGMLTSMSWDSGSFANVVGLDLEWADVFLRQTQFGETEGSGALVTRDREAIAKGRPRPRSSTE